MNEYPIRTFNSLGLAQAWYNNDIVGASDPATIASDNALISSVYAGPQDYQRQLFGNGQASYQSNISVSGSAGQTQYYVSGLSKYDNGSMLNTGYNKQSFRANLSQQFLSAVTVTANINYIHDVARRGITGNDNIGISPYDVFSYTPGFVNMQQQNADGTWPSNPFGPANPFADALEISTPQQTSRTMGGGSLNWTPWKTEHQSLELTAVGGMDLTSFSALLYAPPDLQVEQREPSGLPGTSVSNTDQINYFNYQLNLIHHYTGLSWLDATTSIGFERDRRSNTEPVNVGYNLLSGVNAPTAGTVQNSFFYNSEELDQSFYAQEQALLFSQRLTVTGGVTAERSTNDGNINRFYYYPHYSAAFRLPGMPSFFNEVKLRAAYGQSGNLAPYGSKYTPLPPVSSPGTRPSPATSSSAIRALDRSPKWRRRWDSTRRCYTRAPSSRPPSIRSGCRVSCSRRVSRHRLGTYTSTPTAASSPTRVSSCRSRRRRSRCGTAFSGTRR